MASAQEQAAAPLKVLIVEDNPVIRQLFVHGVRRLRQEDESCPAIEIYEVEDGVSALRVIESTPIHLAVVDLYLPVLGGIELIKRIRDNPDTATVKVLAMSASFIDAKDRSLGAGADDFLQKPLQLVDVLDSLRTLLRRHL